MRLLLSWTFVLAMSYLAIGFLGLLAKVWYLIFMSGWNLL